MEFIFCALLGLTVVFLLLCICAFFVEIVFPGIARKMRHRDFERTMRRIYGDDLYGRVSKRG